MRLAQKRADYTRRSHAAASTRAASARTARAFPASLRKRVAPAPHEKRPALGEAFFAISAGIRSDGRSGLRSACRIAPWICPTWKEVSCNRSS